MKKNIVLVLLCGFLLFVLSGCSPKPIDEALAREELQSYFEGKIKNGAMTAVGDVLEYTIGDDFTRDTSEERDTLYYNVTTVENGGWHIGHYYMDYNEPKIQEDAIYGITYLLNDNKEWVLDKIEKTSQEDCIPLSGLREEGFLETIEFDEKLKATFVSKEENLEEGVASFIVDTSKKYLLYSEEGQKEYTFTFNKSQKYWENTSNKKIGDWNYTYTFSGNRDWMYDTDADDEGGKTHIGLQLHYNEENGYLTATYVAGYVDKYGRALNRSVEHTWSGKASPEDPLVFTADNDTKKLKIINNGAGINFDGYTFHRLK